MQISPHATHLSSQQLRALRVVPGAARRGGGRGSSSDGMRNSGWQDRLYSAGDAPDSSSSTRGQQRHRGGSKHTRRDSRDRAPAPYTPSGSSSQQQPYSRSRELSDAGSSDFVVIKKGSAGSVGSYIPTTQELQVQEDELDGSRYWDAAIQDFDEDEEEGEWEDEGELDGEDEGADEDEDVEVEEVISLLQELAAGLEDEESGLLHDGTTTPAADASEPGAAVRHEQQQQQQQHQGAVGAAVEWRQSYLGSSQPPLTLGAVYVKDTAGKGRGLFTTSAVAAGDVLLVGAPLVLLWSEEGTTPENEELAEHLVAAVAATAAAPGSSSSSKGLSPWQQQALLQLRPPGGQNGQQQQQVLPDLRQLLGPPEEPVKMQQQQQQQQPTVQQQQHLPDAEVLTQVVFANCTGEEFEDQALVLLRGTTSCGHLGVWPAAALINHACAPNCHAMLLGDRLVVRAAHDIPAAAELTLSYLGPQLFAPAAERQAELKQQWGFDCSCSRCKAEARYAGSSSSSSLAQELQSAYSRCQQLSPELDVAVDEEDVAALRGIQQELLGLQASLEASIRAAKPPANVRRWLQASVYDLYDLLSLAADQVPPPPPKASRGGRGGRGRGASSSSSRDMPAVETEALATCARIVGEITPGSSAHVELATEYMVRTEARFGNDHQESADASRLCAAAITTRYAPISDGMLQLLMDTWAGAALL